MLRLRTFGGLSIERSDGAAPPISVSAARRRLALLAVLAASDRPVSRDKLLVLFWPERDEPRARHSLDQTLYALKRDMANDNLFVGRDELSLNPAEISSDIADFAAAITGGDHEAAVAVYAGDFLDGVFVAEAPDFERWTADKRASFARDYEDALETLANDAVTRDDHRDAARWWELLAARNPRRTHVIVALMSQLAQAGDRDAALRHAEMYHTLARDDGDAEPNPTVAALADKLRKAPAAGIGVPEVVPYTAPPVPTLETKPASAGPRRRRLAFLTVVGAVGILAAWTLFTRGGDQPPGRILPAELENRTGDSAFDGSLDALLRAGLEQSKRITVFPRTRVPATLARMGRSSINPPRLDEFLAREVAQREGINAIVTWSIDRVETSYVLTARLVDVKTGEVLWSGKQIAKQRADVLTAVDEIVRRLRKGIGESASALARHDRPLPQATTQSLEALRRFADGSAARAAGRQDAAFVLWQEAVTLDSNFALAHAALGVLLYFRNDRPSGDRHFDRALSLLDRLTDRERFQVRATIESWRGNRDNAIAIRRALLDEYPDDPRAWGLIGYDYMRLDRSADAVDALRRQIARDSTDSGDHINLATALSLMGDYEAALRSYTRAFELQPSLLHVMNLNHEYGTTLIATGRIAAARAVFDTLRSGTPTQRAQAERSLALLAMHLGKFGEAIEHFRNAILLSQRPKFELTEARNRVFLSEAQREKGWTDSARAELLAARRIFEHTYLEPTFLMYLGKALVRQGEPAAAAAVFDSLRSRAKPDNPTDLRSVRVLAGELALAAGNRDSALRMFRLAAAFDSTSYVLESLGRALALTGNAAAAIPIYERLGVPKAVVYEGDVITLTARRELGRLYEQVRDTARARAAYQSLLTHWSAGDTDLVSVRDARESLNRLRVGSLNPVKR